MLNPASHQYWTRAAVELRQVQTFGDGVQFTVRGVPVPAPSFPSGADELEHRRAFRQFVNEWRGGDLPGLAGLGGVEPSVLHFGLRNGSLATDQWQTLVDTLGLGPEEVSAWSARLILTDPRPPTVHEEMATESLKGSGEQAALAEVTDSTPERAFGL